MAVIKHGNVTSVRRQITLCDPIWHVSSRNSETSANLSRCLLYFTYCVRDCCRLVCGVRLLTFTCARVRSRPKGSVRSASRRGPTRSLYSAQPTWSVYFRYHCAHLSFFTCAGMQHRLVNARVNSCTDASALCKNLVKMGPVCDQWLCVCVSAL